MGVRLLALMLAAGLARPSMAGEPTILTVAEVAANIHPLNGQVVRVVGVLDRCAGYDCRLVTPDAELRATNLVHGSHPQDFYLSIGYDPAFDKRAAPFQGRSVIVTGMVSDGCRGPIRCLDRADDLTASDIASWPATEPVINRRL